MKAYDVIVVGGGPAGLMAAIAARETGARVALVEKGHKPGRKLGISGGGRCNVTNAKPLPELMDNIPGNPRFLYSALSQFSNHDIIDFFENLGIRLKEEDRGRVFPVTDQAATVVKAIVDKVYTSGVDVMLDTPVARLLANDGKITGVRLTRGQTLETSAVVISTGGCSVPKTGSTGDAYPWVQALGHTIVDPYPTEVPLTSNEPFIVDRKLQGLSLRGVDVTVWNEKDKRLTTENGDLLFTHLGLSGPAALRCSHYVSTAKRKNPGTKLRATIDVLPNVTRDELSHQLFSAREEHPRRSLANALEQWVPERLASYVLNKTNVNGSTQLTHVSKSDSDAISGCIKACPVVITGTLPLEQATVTGGGVSVKEVDPKSMQSKLCQGLFFAGEVLDVHAHTGGYNITVAFSTGRLAGRSAAMQAMDGDRVVNNS
ncbi:NAD(P)/FAD-dependent oxidoreductase [Alicyclobacillus dauci]|uniref:NAD(P)/FAD-dependent oxidoreductase n=1 Tax=Alicyclobacillus dauci TaxID=1475485 RepID=A0ABY6YZ81_9BACL|nr:NAD(P)/FAD-dependent oxidoreductase [Alicyclobacillus dauci]WAH35929.1 NAD(P)/FAD-dependent oxidoreductase [Alicyclobacillus dauci]